MKAAALFFAGLLALQNAGAQPSALAELAGADRAVALVRGEKPGGVQFKNPKPVFAPANPFVRDTVTGLVRNLKPTFFVENLSLYHKPWPRPWTEAERTALYNECLALSSLAGIRYFSPSRGEMRTFYETSVVVSGADGKKKQSDPSYTVPPEELSVYARQKDLSFGDNVYRYDYYARADLLIFVQENLTAMNYGILPAIGKNKLRSLVAVLDAGEYLLIYTASMAKAAALPGMGERVGNSFSTRADAVLKWFSGRADRAFAGIRD